MKNIYTGFCMFVVPLVVAACATVSQGNSDNASLRSTISPDDEAVQGTWKPAKAELAGQSMPDAVLKSISLKMDNGMYEVLVGTNPDRGIYTLESAAQPKGMSVTGNVGPNSGKTFPAIYELRGDTLRICYDLSGKNRPTEFRSIAGTRLYLVVYHREKK